MNRNLVLFSIIAITFAVASCGSNKNTDNQKEIDSPENDAKKMIDKIVYYTDVAEKAGNDKNLDDKEIEELNKLFKDLSDYEKDMGIKYKNDSIAMKKVDAYFQKEKETVDKVYQELFSAMTTLYECEGADKLEQ